MTADLVSDDDQPVTSRRRKRVECPTCHRRMRENSIPRHRQRWHPQVSIPSLEVEGKVVVRERLTYTALKCAGCKEVIPAGTPQSTLLPGRRRTDWAHVVCPKPSASGAPPPNPREGEPPGTLALSGLGAAPSPTPSHTDDPPAPSATVGDVLLSADAIAELGVTGSRISAGILVLEFRGLGEDQVRDRERRLLGGAFVRCKLCVDKETTVLESQMGRHHAVDHAGDIARWINQGVANDLKRAALKSLPPRKP